MLLRAALNLMNRAAAEYPTRVPAALERFDFHAGVDDDAPMKTEMTEVRVDLQIKDDPYLEH